MNKTQEQKLQNIKTSIQKELDERNDRIKDRGDIHGYAIDKFEALTDDTGFTWVNISVCRFEKNGRALTTYARTASFSMGKKAAIKYGTLHAFARPSKKFSKTTDLIVHLICGE